MIHFQAYNENKIKMKTYQKFSTEDFYLSTFLISKDIQLVSIDRTNSRRCKFVFEGNSKIEKLVQAFNFAVPDCKDIMVDARKLANAIKDLKTKLYSRQ